MNDSSSSPAQAKRQHASMQVRNYLGAIVMRGELKPGDRLPTERDLARELHVSRASLREGIAHLNTLGVLRSIHGVGTFVATRLHYGHLEGLREFYNLPNWQMREARLVLEPQAASLAAQRATKEQIANIGEEIVEMSAAADSPGQYQLHDTRFHRLIAAASGNPVLSALIESVTETLAPPSPQSDSADTTESTEMHRRIYRSIRLHDSKGARLAMEQHLSFIRISAEGSDRHNGHRSREVTSASPPRNPPGADFCI